MNVANRWIDFLPDRSTDPEEFANVITHGLGFVLSTLGAVAMTLVVFRQGDGWRIVGCLIYAVSLVNVYAMSTLSHICTDPELRRYFRMLDQGFIYVLIAATYTPFSLAHLRTVPWWLFLGLIWTIALLGFFSKILLEKSSTWKPSVPSGWISSTEVGRSHA